MISLRYVASVPLRSWIRSLPTTKRIPAPRRANNRERRKSETMISVNECAAITGLRPNELALGATLSERHYRLLSSYLLNINRGAAGVCAIIVADIRGYLDLGIREKSADLLIVLRLLLSKHPLECRSTVPQLAWSETRMRRSDC